MARRLEEEVREGGGKAKKRGERWEGERERELACLFCMLITDVGKARSRFCWEAFIAHEKAGCLLKKNYLQDGGEGRKPQGPHRAGDCSCPGAAGWEGQEGLEPWLPRVPQSLGGKGVLYFEATSSMAPTDCFPGEVFVWVPVPSFTFLCLVLAPV